MEIVPGLHQLKTPFPAPALPYIIPYVFEGQDGGISLFDAGFGTPEAIEAMTRQLADLGYAPKDIRRIFISHAHPDHIGMAGWIKEQSPDCDVIMMEREWQWIQDRWLDGEAWTKLSDAWLVQHGVPQEEIDAAHEAGALSPTSPAVKPGEKAPPPPANNGRQGGSPMFQFGTPVTLPDGDIVEFDGWSLQAVWTPGHTPGHMCIYETNHRLMFTGDHVLPYISPNVSLHADQEGSSPLAEFRDSLKKVASFDVARALPAHEFTMADLRGRCDILLHHHDDRLSEVRDAIGTSGPVSARTISQTVKWNTGPFDDFNIFMKRSALGETLAHLRLLEGEERVRHIEDAGRILWEQVN
ncbi:MAG: MBL fold metallo-hydrolase [Chloroflexi bacterium]|nr:MBL fold metallo-hydrolase [Chloroflexota bacterium]